MVADEEEMSEDEMGDVNIDLNQDIKAEGEVMDADTKQLTTKQLVSIYGELDNREPRWDFLLEILTTMKNKYQVKLDCRNQSGKVNYFEEVYKLNFWCRGMPDGMRNLIWECLYQTVRYFAHCNTKVPEQFYNEMLVKFDREVGRLHSRLLYQRLPFLGSYECPGIKHVMGPNGYAYIEHVLTGAVVGYTFQPGSGRMDGREPANVESSKCDWLFAPAYYPSGVVKNPNNDSPHLRLGAYGSGLFNDLKNIFISVPHIDHDHPYKLWPQEADEIRIRSDEVLARRGKTYCDDDLIRDGTIVYENFRQDYCWVELFFSWKGEDSFTVRLKLDRRDCKDFMCCVLNKDLVKGDLMENVNKVTKVWRDENGEEKQLKYVSDGNTLYTFVKIFEFPVDWQSIVSCTMHKNWGERFEIEYKHLYVDQYSFDGDVFSDGVSTQARVKHY